MKRKLTDVKLLAVKAGVRYWEDAKVNGVEDTVGDLIPFHEGGYWRPVIELESGLVRDWPQGMVADIHYKVCDDGEYFLADANGHLVAKWKDDYVPDSLLCPTESGYGDYIILRIDGDGKIDGWKVPSLKDMDWELLK